MNKVIVRQKTGGNEWIAFAATLAFLIGSVLMIISHFNKKVDATIPVLIAFIGCTIIVLVVTIRLFCTRNVLVLKDNKLILKDVFMNKKLDLSKIEYIKYFQKRNELRIKFKKNELIIIPKKIDLEYLEELEIFEIK